MSDAPACSEKTEAPAVLIAKLESLIDGEAAAERLIAMGPRSIPWLEQFLLCGSARTVAAPRCCAVHALGELGAWFVLIAYFQRYRRPDDAAVLFAEDAVRSVAAQELSGWKTDVVYEVLLKAAGDRVTSGVIRALTEFHKAESIPVFFDALADDLCRADAREGLMNMPEPTRAFATLSLRDAAGPSLYLASAVSRRRATLQLLRDLGVGAEEWPMVREFLDDVDVDSVIATAAIGFAVAPQSEYSAIVGALFRVAQHLNWAQEDEVLRLLSEHEELAKAQALRLVHTEVTKRHPPNLLNPWWRIVRHLLSDEMEPRLWGSAPKL
jgi:hypothetical protein